MTCKALFFSSNQTKIQQHQQQKANLQDDVDVVADECKPLDKLLLLPELDDDDVLITLADDDVV